MRTTWSFFTAGQIVFGPGSVNQLGELADRHNLRRIFLVTDATLQNLGIVERAKTPLENAGCEVEVFAEGKAEPPIETAVDAIAAAREYRPDAILGLGGGSNMDLAKFVAAGVAHAGQPSDFFGFDRVPGPVAPIIAVPTTSGTGSEVSHAAVLTDTANEMKVSMLSNYLRPNIAVVDPELTYSCPKQVAADSGIDALTHAIEAYTAVDYTMMEEGLANKTAYEGRFPLGETIAEKAISLVAKNLVDAVNDPDNLVARNEMALASTLAGIAFSNCGVALVHALEYPLGGALHCSHGGGNGLLLPFVMKFNLPERIPAFARIAKLLGCNVSGLADEDAAVAAIQAVEQLKIDIGIPLNIRELGGKQDQLPGFAEKAFALERLRLINPRPATLNDFIAIYEDAF
jgi:alcohol dehydrogenase class IV